MKYLVIVESPAKSKTIEKYLGSDFTVKSSMGHIRDLATSGKFGFGIDVDNGFIPTYKRITGKKKLINELKKEIKDADKVYLATDPDREGEAISYHLKEELGITEDSYERIVFNEITKPAVIDSLKHARKIDYNLVNSQETRRFLDRIIGFRLSNLMKTKIGSKSAGRVQSVALKLIVDKEREIKAFIIEEYYTIHAYFDGFDAEAFKYGEEKLEIKSKEESIKILNDLNNAFEIESVSKSSKNKHSKPPFITSTLQQEASNKLGFSAKRTMSVAQKLYEGIELESETTGLITYMRTDSIRLSEDFTKTAFAFIKENYGDNYIGSIKKAKKSKDNVQDAHEAIRPTNINYRPENVKRYLKEDEYKLYRMIYYRTVASMMASAKVLSTTFILDNNDYKFKATGSVLVFDGYLKVYLDYEKSEDKILPDIENYNTKILIATKIEDKQHFTEPPARYSEAKLIKELEELGIGRPSTYSSIISTLIDRDYVNTVQKRFVPTDLGIETTDALQGYFQSIINVKYTANMETDLDAIAENEKKHIEVLSNFYNEFTNLVDNAYEKMEKKQPEKTGEQCPNCNNDLVIKHGKYGEFIACSNYPECKYIKQEVKTVCKCPKCDGEIVEKVTKKKKIFYGCNNFPKCKEAYWDKPTNEKCPECNSLITINKTGKLKCSQCDYKK
ncbi:MAG: type I DNA topoisomerase [Bacilli bacterium]